MKPSEVIDKALTDYIPDAEHWMRASFHAPGDNGDDKYCMLGALGMAVSGNPRVWRASGPHYRAISDVIEEQVGHPLAVMCYNDRLGRTYDEIRAIFEKARANLQERGE